MTDSRSGYDEESLPWLQEVDDEDAPSGISARTMLVGVVGVLLVAALVAAAFFWIGSRGSGPGGAPELIRAPEGPYKVKPENPGGLDITGESQTTFETSAGVDVDSRLNLPSEPKAQPVETSEQEKASEEAAAPAIAEKAEPAEPRATGAAGSVVQLGAFANRAQAERAWTALSSRFPAVAGTTKMIVPFPGGIRLRAGASSPGEARQVCQSLKTAGEACFIAR